MQKRVLLSFALLLGLLNSIHAQLTFSIGDYVEMQNEEVEIPVIIENFDSLFIFQFTFAWDPDILEYLGAELPTYLTQWNTNSYNDLTSDEGFVRVAWFDNTLSGVNRPDGDSLFIFSFKVIGEKGDITLLHFPDSPLPAQYGAAGTSMPQTPVLNNGQLKVFNDVGNIDPADFGWDVTNSSPNPFSKEAIIAFDNPQASNVRWSIFDITGKLITTEYKAYPAGVNHFVLEQQHLTSNGIYFVQMETPDFVYTQKIEFFR